MAGAAIVTRKTANSASSRARHAIRDIVRVIQTEEYQYKDPITQFLKDLYVDFDFEAAQQSLTVAERVVENDFFLGNFRQDFMDNARYLISEAYCRIHQKIDIECAPCPCRASLLIYSDVFDSDLSARLNLSQEEGEKWIVNLIRDMRMGADAKIDLEKVRLHRFSPELLP